MAYLPGSPALRALVEAGRAPLADFTASYPSCRAIGTLCSYVPPEIVHAAGFAPLRLRGTPDPLRLADAHLQSFTCALCRSTFDRLLRGDLRVLAGAVLAHSCDTMQALADLWRMHAGADHFVDVVMLPTNLGSPAARPYLVAEFDAFRRRVGAFGGRTITDDDLRASIALFDETRRLVARLDGLRGRLGAVEFYAVLDAAQAMPREQFNSLLGQLLDSLEGPAAPPPAPATNAPGLFLVGAVLDEPRLLELIEGLRMRVAGDDLCSGLRQFSGLVGTGGEPIAALAEHALRRAPCPTKYRPTHDPARQLLDRVRTSRSDGVLFILEKFCEPHAFDYALVRPAIEQAGVPHLVLDMESNPSLEALRTRMQAFAEILA